MFSSLRSMMKANYGGRRSNGASTQDENEYGEVRYRPLLGRVHTTC